MKDFLWLLGWLSLAGTVLGLAVWAVDKLWGVRLGRVFCCGLWALVLLRLMLPFGVPGGQENPALFTQLERKMQHAEVAAQAEAEAAVQRQLDAIPGASLLEQPQPQTPPRKTGMATFEIDYPQKPAAEEKAAEKAQQQALAAQPPDSLVRLLEEQQQVRAGMAQQRLYRVLFWVWAAGAGAFALRLAVNYTLFRRRVLRAAQDVSDGAHAVFGCLYHGSRLRITGSTAVTGAMALGLLQPVVVLPAGSPALQDPARLTAVLRHELTHYRRGDLWLKWAAALTACVHWFNPLVWLLQKQISRACELACDEQVIRTMTAAEKQHYGETLLAFAGSRRAAVPLTAVCERRQQLKERLVNIMKYKKKGFFTALLCAVLALGLIGCAAVLGPTESGSVPVTESDAAVDTMSAGKEEKAVAALVSDTAQPQSVKNVATQFGDYMDWSAEAYSVLIGDRLWTYGYRWIDRQAVKTQKTIASVGLDGSDPQVMDIVLPEPDPALVENLPEGQYLYFHVERLLDMGDERPWAAWYMYVRTGEGEDVENVSGELRLSPIDENGRVGEGIRVDYTMTGKMSLTPVGHTPGFLWQQTYAGWPRDFSQKEHLLVFSTADGSLAADIELPECTDVSGIQALADGRVLLQLCPLNPMENGYEFLTGESTFYILEPEKGSFAVKEPFSVPSDELLPHGGGNLWLPQYPVSQRSSTACLITSHGLYRWDVDRNELTRLYDWQALGASDFFTSKFDIVLQDDRLLHYEANKNRIRIVSLAENVPLSDDSRAVITVGGTNVSDSFRTAIEEFNLANADVRVELLDYSDAAAEKAGFESGLDMLGRHLIQGGGPDVVLAATSASSADLYNKGLFADLYPYIDADPDLSREDFFPSVLKACEQGGRLLTVAPSFGIKTVLGSAERFGTLTGWTPQQFAEATAGCATPFYGYSRELLLWYQLNAAGKSFIDYSLGKAYLNTPAFIRLLEACAAYPAETDLAADPKQVFAQGEALLYAADYFTFASFPEVTYYFNGPITFTGYPNAEGGSGSCFVAGWQVGIRSTCADPDTAWRFVRQLLLPAYQEALLEDVQMQHQLPLRQDAVSKLIRRMQKDDRTSFSVPSGVPQPLTEAQRAYFSRAITQQECDALLALIDATDTFFRFDSTVVDILFEEAGYYYNGIRTAAEAAAVIQNRIQTYLDEQA